MDRERIQAQVNADAVELDRIYADDFIGIGPSGTLRTKKDVLSDFTSGRLKFQSITTDDVRIRVYGNCALAFVGLTCSRREPPPSLAKQLEETWHLRTLDGRTIAETRLAEWHIDSSKVASAATEAFCQVRIVAWGFQARGVGIFASVLWSTRRATRKAPLSCTSTVTSSRCSHILFWLTHNSSLPRPSIRNFTFSQRRIPGPRRPTPALRRLRRS